MIYFSQKCPIRNFLAKTPGKYPYAPFVWYKLSFIKQGDFVSDEINGEFEMRPYSKFYDIETYVMDLINGHLMLIKTQNEGHTVLQFPGQNISMYLREGRILTAYDTVQKNHTDNEFE